MRLKDIVSQISEHEIFKMLTREFSNAFENNKDPVNFMSAFDNELFLWNKSQSSINVIYMKASYLDNKENNPFKFYQVLELSNPPNFSVEFISCNFCGNYIALFGKKGICIVEKPPLIWIRANNSSPFKSQFCRSFLIDEDFFNSNDSLSAFKWHPGSQYGKKFVFLTSNNSLRIYCVSKCNEPLEVHQLSIQDVSQSINCLPTGKVLGDICVAFDFGEPFETVEKAFNHSNKTVKKLWPIYLLFENGDIYETFTECSNKSTKVSNLLRGPLLMYPPAEDNYGSDACSLLYISNTPPILAIATQEGKIYNCLLLSQDEERTGQKETLMLVQLPRISSLYVFERVDVELFLSPMENAEIAQTMVQILLYPDAFCANRYYCFHSSGIYSIFMSWLPKITEFCLSDKMDETFNINENSIVKHMFCTKPFNSKDGELLIGFAMAFDHLVGCHFLCLTDQNQCHILQNIQVKDLPLTIEMSNVEFENRSLHNSRNSILNKINAIFHKETTNPIIRCQENATPEFQFQLLCRMTQIFREEYIQKFGLARIELTKCAQRLMNAKRSQEEELAHLEEEMRKLSKMHGHIQEKLARMATTQSNFKTRLEDASLRLYKTISVLTNAEENLKNKLDTFSLEISNIKMFSQQLKNKYEKLFSSGSVGAKISSETSAGAKFGSATPTSYSQNQKLASVHACLAKESQEISNLINQTNRLKSILDV